MKALAWAVLGYGAVLSLAPALFSMGRELEIDMNRNGKFLGSLNGSISLESGDLRATLRIRNGRISLPESFLKVDHVYVQIRVAKEQIRARVSGKDLHVKAWTIVIADTKYPRDYWWFNERTARVRSSCVFAFDPFEGDGTMMFHPDCRNR